MQKIAVLGSTGSIGTSALDVISRFPDRFKVSSLSANSNTGLLSRQIKRFRPRAVSVVDKRRAREFAKTHRRLRVYEGAEGLCSMIREVEADMVVVGIVGSSALLPIMTAISRIRRIALANKEAVVMAGDIIIREARKKKVSILPIDSEHSAIFQCMASGGGSGVKKIYLTGSGGPLLKTSKKELRKVTPQMALNHPKWKMGRKISVDSATMMNKGLEVIEAHHLFGLEVKGIEVLIHPEAVVHSMVEFVDGSILAQMGPCDMRVPIQYALTYPGRDVSPVKQFNFSKIKALHFYSPDLSKFPCLEMAYEACRCGGTYPCVLNASNEIVVREFLKGRIRFTDIAKVIQRVLGLHRDSGNPGLEEILEADRWGREKTKEILNVVHS